MSGARLPIVTPEGPVRGKSIFVGGSAALRARKPGVIFESLGPEGYVLKTLGSDLVIAGGRPRGTMYGVYGYLDKLGCRWFTENVSRIPKTARIPFLVFNELSTRPLNIVSPFSPKHWRKTGRPETGRTETGCTWMTRRAARWNTFPLSTLFCS